MIEISDTEINNFLMPETTKPLTYGIYSLLKAFYDNKDKEFWEYFIL